MAMRNISCFWRVLFRISSKRMAGWLVVILLTLTMALGEEDWSVCPSTCKCKWVSGKKVAECVRVGLSTVPDRLSSEIQSIDLSENSLHSLPSEAFANVGLINLHKISLKECGITELHKDAFKGLQILIELNLSHNRIHTIHPGTFRDNQRLRLLFLNHNSLTKLEDSLFVTSMVYLQTVDVSDCNLSHIGHKTFLNAPNLQHLRLNDNNLVHMKVAAVESLQKLTSLVLNNNPWRCDCHLKAFRNWTIERNLYVQPTSCVEPPSLAGRNWNEISQTDFACKPQIIYPPVGKIIEVFEEEVTLSCKVVGNPPPEVYWVANGRVIPNNTRTGFGDSRYSFREGGGWVNLTINRVRAQDKGELKCVANSPGGIDERNITLVVPDSGPPGSTTRLANNWPLILGLTIIAFIVLLVLILMCCYCVCRKRQTLPRPKKLPETPNGDLSHPEKSLLTVVNPVQKPPRRYEDRPTELAELNRNLLDDTATSVGGEFEERSTESAATTPNFAEAPHYPPDLLAFPRGTSTPPHLQSPIHGTLPYSRSQSPFSPTRPGYVTIPRRPRVPSWSSAPTPTLLEDPLLGLLKAEPVYDNLGPRTTADGSSVLSLNKTLPEQPRPKPLHCNTLPAPRKAPHPRIAPEGATLSRTTSAEGPLSPVRSKVPPKPPPKPKKNGPLYEDEGEDGTEV